MQPKRNPNNVVDGDVLPLTRDSKVDALGDNVFKAAGLFGLTVTHAHPSTGSARTTVLATESKEERDEWVACLQFTAQRCATLALATAGPTPQALRTLLTREVPNANIFKRGSPEWKPEVVALCGSVIATYATPGSEGSGGGSSKTRGSSSAGKRSGSVFSLFGSGKSGRNLTGSAAAAAEADAAAAAENPVPTTITLLDVAHTSVQRGDGPGIVHVVGKVEKLALKAASAKLCTEWMGAIERSVEAMKTSGLHVAEVAQRGRKNSVTDRAAQWESSRGKSFRGTEKTDL